MAYLALYRRYRPTGFDKLIGQDHIVRILKNQIKEDKVGHAYLFSGARGVGKTSAAKIFAKAINCEHPVDGSPCGKCPSCKALSDSNSIDVSEIDAASNNRVDEIRELRENAQYPPVNVKYKVFIIDEVHMLSDSAFNALLKTLEEPPAHAVFILATTEPQKLPATILSRCMRFDFRLVSDEELIRLIGSVFDDIGLKYESEAVKAIARAGEGSVRDSLSIADKCVSFTEGKLTYKDVLEVLGSADRGKLVALVDAISRGDIGSVLSKTDELITLGKSVPVLSRDLSKILRDICVIKSVEGAEKILALPESAYAELQEISRRRDVNAFLRFLELFAAIEQDIRYSLNPRVLFEVTALKCAKATNDLSYDGLTQRVLLIEEKIARAEGAQSEAAREKQIPKTAEIAARKQAAVQSVLEKFQYRKEACDAADCTSRKSQTESEANPPAERDKGHAVSSEALSRQAAVKLQTPAGKDTALRPPDGETFGALARDMRQSGNELMFKLLQSVKADCKNGVLQLMPFREEAADFLKKREILDEISLWLTLHGYEANVAVRDASPSKDDAAEEQIKELSKVLGIDIQIQ